MQYKVAVFYNGEIRERGKIEASSPLMAAKLVRKPSKWSHVLVVGKQIKRFYGKKYVEIKDTPLTSRVLWRGKFPSILALYGTVAEFYRFKEEKERDTAYEEIQKCITSMSAGFARAKAELTGIIASLDEINGTKSISTSKKTSNGSVTSATCKDLPTLESIARNFGTGKSEDTDTNTWFGGLKGFHLEHDQTFLATVKDLPKGDHWTYPGINESMMGMQGNTYAFKYSHTKDDKKYYNSINPKWMWDEKWITPRTILAKVKKLPEGTKYVPSNGAQIIYNRRFAGKTLALEFCTCGCGGYKHLPTESYFKAEWLEVSNE